MVFGVWGANIGSWVTKFILSGKYLAGDTLLWGLITSMG